MFTIKSCAHPPEFLERACKQTCDREENETKRNFTYQKSSTTSPISSDPNSTNNAIRTHPRYLNRWSRPQQHNRQPRCGQRKEEHSGIGAEINRNRQNVGGQITNRGQGVHYQRRSKICDQQGPDCTHRRKHSSFDKYLPNELCSTCTQRQTYSKLSGSTRVSR